MKNLILKVVILSAVPLIVGAFAITQPKPVEEAKKEKIPELAENVANTKTEVTIEPTITQSPTPTQTVKPTATATPTVKPTVVVTTPVPTEYVKYSNPTNTTQEMENKICKVYGEKDCPTVIKWATAENPRLSPYYQASARYGLGVLAIDCTMGTKILMNKTDMGDEEFLTYCRSIIFDTNTNINMPLELYKTKGIAAVEEYLRFGTVR